SEVILLDEPTLGINIETGYEVRELLRNSVEKNNCTSIITSHDMDVIQDLCEVTVILDKGRIVTDDRLENLMRLFAVRSSSITLGEKVTDKQHVLLQQKFPHFKYDSENIQPRLVDDLVKSEDIYLLFDIFKIENTPVEPIDRSMVNFEQVFMKILKGENGNELAPSS